MPCDPSGSRRLHRLAPLVALLTGLLVVGACNRPDSAQLKMFDAGRDALDTGRYELAAEEFSRFLEEAPLSSEFAIALYLRGTAAVRLGRAEAAEEDFLRCIALRRDREATWQSQVALANLYFDHQRWAAAAALYSEAAAEMPPLEPMDLVLLRRGFCLERLGEWALAQEAFRETVEQFPRTAAAAAAERRIALQADAFAIRCATFATRAKAEESAALLARSGLEPRIISEPVVGVRGGGAPGSTYSVLVGRFDRYADAIRELEAVKKSVPKAELWP